jgi:RNA polymerase sigma factor (sigma-70 family)
MLLNQRLREMTEKKKLHLYRKYISTLEAFVRNKFKYRRDLDDLIQEASITFWENIHKLDETNPKVKAWVKKVAYNACIKFIRETQYEMGHAALKELNEIKRRDQENETLDGFDFRRIWLSRNHPAYLHQVSTDTVLYHEEGDPVRIEDIIKNPEGYDCTSLDVAIANLTEVKQLVAVLHFIEGLTLEEVSEIWGGGESAATMMRRKDEALEELERLLCQDLT